MTIIALCSIIGSIVVMIAFICSGILGLSPATFLLLVIGNLLDVLLDTVCISLSLNVNRTVYRTLCKICDSHFKRCCVSFTDRTTRKKEMELAAATRSEQIE